MKKHLWQKTVAVVSSLATIGTFLTLPVSAKYLPDDGVQVLVDPANYQANEQYLSSNITMRENGPWLNSAGRQYVYESSDSSISGKYVQFAYNFGEDFWTETNKTKAIVFGIDAYGYGAENSVLYDANDLPLTADWQSNTSCSYRSGNVNSSQFNRYYFVYYVGNEFALPEYHPGLEGYGCAYDIYVNGQSTIEENTHYNWQARGEAERYPSTLKLKFYNNSNEGMWSYFSNFSVYVCDYDKVADICNDVVAATDNTGAKYATTALTGTETTTSEVGYLGKAVDDVSTHVVSTSGSAQTFNVPTGFFKCDSSSPANDKRYMVVGAQFAASNDTNYITYLGLFEGANQYYTPACCPWNSERYGYSQQWNQIYIVYDRSTESTDLTDRSTAVRGKTYIYMNGQLMIDGLYRTGVWGEACDDMTQIKLFAMHNADVTGGDMDMHWDNFEVFFTDTLPDLTQDMPALVDTENYTLSGYNVTINSKTTVADVASNGSIRAYRNGDINSLLSEDDRVTTGDTISVDLGDLVREYTVVADNTPVDPEINNLLVYSPMVGNALVASWINPAATLSNVTLKVNDEVKEVTVDTAANAKNEVLIDGLTAGTSYTITLTATIDGTEKTYTATGKAGVERTFANYGLDGITTASWITIGKDNNGYYADTIATVKNDATHGNYAEINANLPEAHDNTFGGIAQEVTLEAQNAYILKFKAKSDNSNKLKVMSEIRNDSGYYAWNAKAYTLTPSWTEYTYAIDNVDSTADAKGMFYLYAEDACVGTIDIDDVAIYYYDTEEGALEDLGNLVVQGDFETLEVKLNDPTASVADGQLDVIATTESAGLVTALVAVYKDGTFVGLSSVTKNSLANEEYSFSIPIDGDWAEDNYSAKFMWINGFTTLTPQRAAYQLLAE